MNTAAIAAGVAVGVGGLICIAVIAVLLVAQRKRRRTQSAPSELTLLKSGQSPQVSSAASKQDSKSASRSDGQKRLGRGDTSARSLHADATRSTLADMILNEQDFAGCLTPEICIAKGYCGSVYAVQYKGSIFALKVFDSVHAGLIQSSISYLKELSLLSKLDHRHLVRFLGHTHVEGKGALLFEFCEGTSISLSLSLSFELHISQSVS